MAKTDCHKFSLVRPWSHCAERLTGNYPRSVNIALMRYLAIATNTTFTSRFTDSEWGFIQDACASWETQAEDPEELLSGLLLRVSEAVLTELPQKWGISGRDMLRKFKNMTLAEAIAIVYKIERRKESK